MEEGWWVRSHVQLAAPAIRKKGAPRRRGRGVDGGVVGSGVGLGLAYTATT